MNAEGHGSTDSGFREWLVEFLRRAAGLGIDGEALAEFERTAGINEQALSRDREQLEFALPIWEYVDRIVTSDNVQDGLEAIGEHGETLSRVEEETGVDSRIVAAIWGIESSYGTIRGSIPALEALATLAWAGRRSEFFERELLSALRIMERGVVPTERLVGSWAGAMGHTQFMPSSYLAHAVSFKGYGDPNIWDEDPADSLASAARFLVDHGWVPGVSWAVPATLTDQFDYMSSSFDSVMTAEEWLRVGVHAELEVSKKESGFSLILPAGHKGPAFLASSNFKTIRSYNNALPYALGVGLLSDYLADNHVPDIVWPRDEIPLIRQEIARIQRALLDLGYDTGGIDGIVGPATTSSIRHYQQRIGAIPDGYPDRELFEFLSNQRPCKTCVR